MDEKATANAFIYSMFENNTSYDNWITNPGLEIGEDMISTTRPSLLIKLDKMWNDRFY